MILSFKQIEAVLKQIPIERQKEFYRDFFEEYYNQDDYFDPEEERKDISKAVEVIAATRDIKIPKE